MGSMVGGGGGCGRVGGAVGSAVGGGGEWGGGHLNSCLLRMLNQQVHRLI